MPFRQVDLSIEGMVGVGIDITEACNRRCPTCFANHTPSVMEESVFRSIVDQAEQYGFRELYILGGEPTLHPKILDFLDYVKGRFDPIVLVTNTDRLSDRGFCSSICESGVVIAGQRHFMSVNEESRKLDVVLTGGNHLELSNQAWRNIEEIFPPDRVCVQCCITRPVVESGSIFEVFRWSRRNGFDPVMEFTKEGGGFKRGCELDISPDEMMKVLKEFQQIDRNEFEIEVSLLGPQAYGKTCHMTENSIHFKVDGSVIPCVGHQRFRLGNIKSNSLEEILQHPLRNVLANPHEWIYGYCKDQCQFFSECTGGCRGSALDIAGCPRASFHYCPHMPKELTVSDMIPPTCDGCLLQGHEACNPKR